MPIVVSSLSRVRRNRCVVQVKSVQIHKSAIIVSERTLDRDAKQTMEQEDATQMVETWFPITTFFCLIAMRTEWFYLHEIREMIGRYFGCATEPSHCGRAKNRWSALGTICVFESDRCRINEFTSEIVCEQIDHKSIVNIRPYKNRLQKTQIWGECEAICHESTTGNHKCDVEFTAKKRHSSCILDTNAHTLETDQVLTTHLDNPTRSAL